MSYFVSVGYPICRRSQRLEAGTSPSFGTIPRFAGVGDRSNTACWYILFDDATAENEQLPNLPSPVHRVLRNNSLRPMLSLRGIKSAGTKHLPSYNPRGISLPGTATGSRSLGSMSVRRTRDNTAGGKLLYVDLKVLVRC